MAECMDAVKEILKGVRYLVNNAVANTTKIYDGLIVSSDKSGKWNVRFNGETHTIPSYGSIEPKAGIMVKVFVPQGNMTLAYFI